MGTAMAASAAAATTMGFKADALSRRERGRGEDDMTRSEPPDGVDYFGKNTRRSKFMSNLTLTSMYLGTELESKYNILYSR